MASHFAYYSEYSVKSWISLLLNSEIKLPPYQRYFVWSLPKAYNLVKAICDGNFIPPVIIASTQHDYSEELKRGTYLIDGQQRLSAILLFYLGVWPKDEKSHKEEHDVENEEELDYIPWTFDELQREYQKHSSFDKFKLAITQSGRYIDFDSIRPSRYVTIQIRNDIARFARSLGDENYASLFQKNLGYSFVKSTASVANEKNLFANMFRDINSTGVALHSSEARNAMYYIEPRLKDLFSPSFLDGYKVGNNKIDFPRYLSFVDELYMKYEQEFNASHLDFSDVRHIAYGYSNKIEEYIINYLTRAIKNNADCDYGEKLLANMSIFEQTFRKMFEMATASKDIPNFEIRIFGLIFWILFDGKKIDTIKLYDIEQKFTQHMEEKREYYSTKKIMGIRDRLKFSIESYKDVLI